MSVTEPTKRCFDGYGYEAVLQYATAQTNCSIVNDDSQKVLECGSTVNICLHPSTCCSHHPQCSNGVPVMSLQKPTPTLCCVTLVLACPGATDLLRRLMLVQASASTQLAVLCTAKLLSGKSACLSNTKHARNVLLCVMVRPSQAVNPRQINHL